MVVTWIDQKGMDMRRVTLMLLISVVALTFLGSGGTAQAHQGHTSCKEFAQAFAGLAQDLGSDLGQIIAVDEAQTGQRAEIIAMLHQSGNPAFGVPACTPKD